MSEKRKILLVDDDRAVLALLKRRLESRRDFEVVVTAHPAMVQRLVVEESPDLVVCDVDMDEKPGGEVAADLAADQATRHVPLLFLSSLVDTSSDADAGGWPMISKAAPLEELLAKIDGLLEG